MVVERWSLRAYTYYPSSCFLRTLNVDVICGFLACEYNNVPPPSPFPPFRHLFLHVRSNSPSFTPTLCYLVPCETIIIITEPLGNYFREPFFTVIVLFHNPSDHDGYHTHLFISIDGPRHRGRCHRTVKHPRHRSHCLKACCKDFHLVG